MNQGSNQFGAHEIIGMNEALMSKSAHVEMLSLLADLATDPQLRTLFEQQAQAAYQEYRDGVSLLQGQGSTSGWASPGGWEAVHVEPKLGLRSPTMPAPNLQAQSPSERSLCTIALNMHKFSAISGTTFALECVDPHLRSYLMNGASRCDHQAYEVWSYMNQKGYYQVPTLLEKTTQTMIQSYQAPPYAPQMDAMSSLQ